MGFRISAIFSRASDLDSLVVFAEHRCPLDALTVRAVLTPLTDPVPPILRLLHQSLEV
jgi:hypothetical protein